MANEKISDDWQSKPIGNEERPKLEAKDVTVQAVEKVTVSGFDKIVFKAKHPDREQPIDLSTAKTIVNDKVDVKTTWLKFDSKHELQKDTPLTAVLTFYGAKTLSEMVGKTIRTVQDPKGYLCIRAY